MSFRRLLLLGYFCLLPSLRLCAETSPVNRSATPATKAVLDFLVSLETKTEQRILTGQFVGYSDQRNARLLVEIPEKTGQSPALVGIDYANHAKGDITVDAPNATALKAWQAGSLITVSTHLYNPCNPRKGGLRDHNVKIADLLVEGTPTHTRWLAELDQIADGLAYLKARGVVVLWRPFHEMNGGWFWWGAQKPADFVAVWKQMYHYFTDTKHLDNLLWVYSPNHGTNADDYYPGDDFVDVVGLDVYTDHIDTGHIKGYEALSKRPKPFGFTEFGPGGAHNPKGDFDYRRLLQGFKTQFPRATFFLSWDDNWTPVRNLNAREFYNDPAVLTRATLPTGKW